jgi:hypothetical protein
VHTQLDSHVSLPSADTSRGAPSSPKPSIVQSQSYKGCVPQNPCEGPTKDGTVAFQCQSIHTDGTGSLLLWRSCLLCAFNTASCTHFLKGSDDHPEPSFTVSRQGQGDHCDLVAPPFPGYTLTFQDLSRFLFHLAGPDLQLLLLGTPECWLNGAPKLSSQKLHPQHEPTYLSIPRSVPMTHQHLYPFPSLVTEPHFYSGKHCAQ